MNNKALSTIALSFSFLLTACHQRVPLNPLQVGTPKPFWLSAAPYAGSGPESTAKRVGSVAGEFFLVSHRLPTDVRNIEPLTPEQAQRGVGALNIKEIPKETHEGFNIRDMQRFCKKGGGIKNLGLSYAGGYSITCNNGFYLSAQ